jgi:DNA-binding MarR family transcriptional regulator
MQNLISKKHWRERHCKLPRILSKTELISHNLQEKTSGTEVIRRLIAAGLVRQWDDVKDKRSKHIAITDEGKELLYKVFVHTNYVGKIITGRLTIAEKFTLQYLLQKLETFHLEHYEKKTILNKEDLKNLAAEITSAQ